MSKTSLIKAALATAALLGATACDAIPLGEDGEETEQNESQDEDGDD